MFKSERARLLKTQHALDITACSNQTPLGRVVTRLMMDLKATVSREELSKLKADDANFLERYMLQPRCALLIGRYAWAPFAAESHLSRLEAKASLINQNHKEQTMEAKSQAVTKTGNDLVVDLTQTIYQEIGTAAGSIIYADGILNFSEVRAKLRSERTNLHMVACPQKAYEAIKALATHLSSFADQFISMPTGVALTLVKLASDTDNVVFDGGQLFCLRIDGDTPGNSVAKTVYFIAGIKPRADRRAAPHNPAIRGTQLRGAAMDTGTYRAGDAKTQNAITRAKHDRNTPPGRGHEKSGHSSLTADCRTGRTSAAKPAPASGVTLRDSIPARVREDMAKREWPEFVEPERDSGIPRKKSSGKKQKGGGSRTERRLK